MSAFPPPADFDFSDSPFELRDPDDSKAAAPESPEHGNSSKRVRVQHQSPHAHYPPPPYAGQHRPFDDDDLPLPAPSGAAQDSEERKDDGGLAAERKSDGEQDDSLHVGNKRRRPPPLHTPPYQPAAESLYSPPPDLETGVHEEADGTQLSSTQHSNEVSNEASSGYEPPVHPLPHLEHADPPAPFHPQSSAAPASTSYSHPLSSPPTDEPIDLTDEDEVLPTPILPISLSHSQQYRQSQPSAPSVLPSRPYTQPAMNGSVPFYSPHGNWDVAAGRPMHSSFSHSPSYPPFPPQPPQAHPRYPTMPAQPAAYNAASFNLPRSHSEQALPSASSSSSIAPVPYSMVSPPLAAAGNAAVVDLTDDADIEADMQRLHAPLASTTPSPPPPPPPPRHYSLSQSHPPTTRPTAPSKAHVKEEISLLDDETEERFGSMLAFIRPTHPLPNIRLHTPVNLYEHPIPGDPSRMRATTDSEEDIGLLNVEASHALCPLLAHRRINIESRVLKIDAVSNMVIVRVNVYGDERDKAEINAKIHQYCPLHYFDSTVADQYINSFAKQQQQPVPASQQFNPSAMQAVQPYISAAFSGPSISELEQHLDSVFSADDLRKGHDIDISSLRMPHCIATQLHDYQKQGLVWMRGREQLKPVWKRKKAEPHKRDPFTGQLVQDDEEVEQFLIWERRTKHGRVRYWNRAKNKFQSHEPVFAKGGILADDMGLGKTLQMIALIASETEEGEEKEQQDDEKSEQKAVKDEVDLLDDDIMDDDWFSNVDDDEKVPSQPPPRSSSRRHVGPTLIVCPLSVITNWQEQIERHVLRNYRWRVYTYHGGQRVRDLGLLEQYDVVITTYNIVSSEWVDEEKEELEEEKKQEQAENEALAMYGAAPPKKSKEQKEEEKDHFPEDNPNSAAARSSPLFAMHWHRIILDEAHNIRERRTRQSRACRALLGTCRWAVTGTPFQNRLDDGYALMHFLRIEPFTSHRWWNKLILEPIKRRDGRGIERLQQVMGSICLRRKKGDELNGRKILSLPDKHLRYLEVELTKEEKALYQVLEVSAHKRFMFLLNEDEALKQYAFVLEMLLRLRQCCDHISLVPDHYYRNGFGLSDDQLDETRRLLELMASEASANDKCKLCRQELGEDEWACVPCCVSVYHSTCLTRHIQESTALHAPNQSNIRQLAGQGKAPCPACQRTVKREQVVTSSMRSLVSAEDQRQEFNASALSASPASHMSSKMLVLLQELQSCISVGDKAVVFSQWTSFLDLLSPALTTAGIRFTRLDGTMSSQHRAAALTSFANNPSVSVFLISLKAGGVGLNLTAANRVYLMDIWWNPAAEDQAVDRVHRLGQTKPVDVVRMIVRGGVEERVQKLQEKKREMTKNAMSRVSMTREETQAERLNDLRALFGVSQPEPSHRG